MIALCKPTLTLGTLQRISRTNHLAIVDFVINNETIA